MQKPSPLLSSVLVSGYLGIVAIRFLCQPELKFFYYKLVFCYFITSCSFYDKVQLSPFRFRPTTTVSHAIINADTVFICISFRILCVVSICYIVLQVVFIMLNYAVRIIFPSISSVEYFPEVLPLV